MSDNTSFTMSSVLSGKWFGIIRGTNLGAVFAEFVDIGERILGTVHINDRTYGASVYVVADVTINPDQIRLVLVPNTPTQLLEHGAITVLAHIDDMMGLSGAGLEPTPGNMDSVY